MIYRLVSGPFIGQITSESKYSALAHHYKYLYEPITDLGSYEMVIFVTHKIGKQDIIQHVFDFETELIKFLRESGHFLLHEQTAILEAYLADIREFILETKESTIKFTRKIENLK